KGTKFIRPSGNPGEKKLKAPLFAAARLPPKTAIGGRGHRPLTLSFYGFGTRVSSFPRPAIPTRLGGSMRKNPVTPRQAPRAVTSRSVHLCDPTRDDSLLPAN
ncbi:hypothetical protein C8A01DRAFT_20071, partial [Parachaetomium inaequale]